MVVDWGSIALLFSTSVYTPSFLASRNHHLKKHLECFMLENCDLKLQEDVKIAVVAQELRWQ